MRARRRTAVIQSANRLCRRVAILAVPPINELDVVGTFQVFGTANRLFGGGGSLYEIEVVSPVREKSVHGYSGLSIRCHLFYQDISPLPREPLPGHVLVDMDASAINHGDKTFLARPSATGIYLAGSRYDV